MRALPPDLEQASAAEVTGLTCPDCFGVLSVAVEGKRHALHFRCRTGHAYSADEVIVGKELKLEEHLWAALTILDELRTLLFELHGLPGQGGCNGSCAERAEEAAAQEQVLRELIAALHRTEMTSTGGPDGRT